MKLYIAEKPSLARAIADALPKPQQKKEGYIQLANGDAISWCVGHLLEQAEPEAYDSKYKTWQLEHLPILPEHWQLKPKPKTRSQLSVLRKLVKQATHLVNAGDPDREGQLLVDEVIAHLGVTGTKLRTTQRLLISDLNQAAVKRALASMRSNIEFVPLSTSALARSRADWLFGLNMTRAYTLQGRKVGYQGVLSVGRVQTPVLGLVVRRDQDIEGFVPKPFYEVLAHLKTDSDQIFFAKWQPSDACLPYMDEEGRVLSKKLAQNVQRRIEGKPARVTNLSTVDKLQNPPLLYSLSSLQIDLAKRFAMSAKAVLDVCQSLYEKHKLITYPRSDSRYLPKSQLALVKDIIAALLQGAPMLVEGHDAPNPKLKSKVWNDSKVDAHHAIVPTEKPANLAALSTQEKQVYLQIARQYLAQFYPAYQYTQTSVEVTIEGGLFTAKANQEKEQGWKQLFPKVGKNKHTSQTLSAQPENSLANAGSSSDTQESMQITQQLPRLTLEQALLCCKAQVIEKSTQPPKPFNDASLLSAMTGISRYVTDPDIRKTLKETDGLGTEATRANIIELLFKRGFLQRHGKSITATEVGKGLISCLPTSATTPDMTALWEQQLEKICRREVSYQSFMAPLSLQLVELISQACAQLPHALSGIKSNAPKRKFSKRRQTKGKPLNRRKSE
ncbi:DNA topoisomerase III [Shewanella gelidii]|uniref:DNA topoisomerase n=1 Tax=Shewanella gelidii TaxID=1642821 RepID=A0A917JP79_9GAMM|nr:DNA topoisomerase III [Shewanella gelidii]MCL1097547.1 DNA topoisomerase III [Shewanella gelidii]GGI76162.1 DNA topoisomerase 3 [Shewanella gelidii]